MTAAHGTMGAVIEAPPHRGRGRGHGPRRSPLSRPQFTHGKGCNNRKLSDADRAEIVRLYTTPLPDGTWMGVTAIARRFAVRHYVIQTLLKKRGVTMRSAAEAHSGGKRCKPIKNLPVGTAPACKCGCGEPTEWNRRKNRWNRLVKGHVARLDRAHPWEGGRSFEPYTLDWPQVSLTIRRRDGFKCQRCFGPSRRLHVHHIDTDKQNNDPENLITLCASCHATVHAGLRGEVVPSCQS
jgi:5-methylcytosine-specific restriction endonuclease McrA